MKKNVIILQANDEEAFECAQNLNENFEILKATSDCEIALEYVLKSKPDFLITSLMLRKGDGVYVVEQTKRVSPKTRCIVLSCVSGGELMKNVIEAGAFCYLIKPVNYQILIERMLSAGKKTNFLPSNNDINKNKPNGGGNIDEKVSRIFIGLGIPPHIKGYGYLREGVKLAVTNPEIINSITKKLYPTIGLKYGTSASKVERAIRHAIEVAWNRGRVDNFNALFGVRIYTEHEKPTNSEFIALIADRLLLDEMA